MKTLQQIANDMYANHGELDAQIIFEGINHIAELEELAENRRHQITLKDRKIKRLEEELRESINREGEE